jgi:indole-3-glycerol phosphate synthase
VPATLDEILAVARGRVADARRTSDLHRLAEDAGRHVCRGFRRSLEAAGGVAVIAELKKASPSRGIIRENFLVGDLARELADGGAAALSVLTDERFFQGSLRNLREASQSTSIPCLRKDFIVDPFQVIEAKANQADAVLLIMAAVSDAEFSALYRTARELQLDVLCEVHDRDELRRAVDLGAEIIGVNSRNLHTFHVDPDTPLRLAEHLPAKVVRVAESGIQTGDEIRRLRDAGYQAFLVGECLMRAKSPGEKLRALLAEARSVGAV